MRPSDIALASLIEENLLSFNLEIRPLPGIDAHPIRECLVRQIIDSIRRIRYITFIEHKQMGETYIDPTQIIFDPLNAAVWHKQHGNVDEAFWLVFLLTHFGKNGKSGWGLARGIYGSLGNQPFWTWERIWSHSNDFRHWLDQHQIELKERGSFGNHHKYQSLDAYTPVGTGSAIASYVEWVGPNNNHQTMINHVIDQVGNEPREIFKHLYNSMNQVASFGRTARFDYLTMIGKLGLAEIEPGSTFMNGATGPKRGARLLFGGNINADLSISTLNNYLDELEQYLNLYFGMQVLEDALCNWQKSPSEYRHFRG
jgi:Alpha-glutamyl/putrescinyl thymine pyrophosphorylase clade 3